MEVVLALIAAVIIFYLYKTFQVYLSNPVMPNDQDVLRTNNQQEIIEPRPILSPKEKLMATEYGIMVRILGKLSFVDNKSCSLEEKLVNALIDDMAKDLDQPKELFLEIYKDASNEDIEKLAELFCEETIAQYKKRLKMIEFMFALSYTDGNFSHNEEEAIISVAAILEIENDDFNYLYDSFKAINEQHVEVTKEEALEIFDISENFTKEELDSKYNEIFEKNRQNVLDPKNLTKPYNDNGGQYLRRVSEAYALLLKN